MRVIGRSAIFLPVAFATLNCHYTFSFVESRPIERTIVNAADVDTIMVLVVSGKK